MTSTILLTILCTLISFSVHAAEHQAIVKEEFVYTEAPFPSCHASTIVEVDSDVLLSAWFGGTGEGDPDVGIWLSRWENGSWSAPVEVAKHEKVPCWNPVLFKMPDGEIDLYYKAGPSPQTWSGLVKRSTDGGKTWSEAELLPAGILGPIKNKPLLLNNGELLCGSSVESWRTWTCWMEITPDKGKTWSKYGPIHHPEELYGIIQPALFYSDEDTIRMVCRSRGNIGKICTATSDDGGKTWSAVEATDLPHPGSGIDAVGLKDGRVAMVYNHTSRGRSPINLGISEDGGKTWKMVLTLEDEPGEYSYPAVIQAENGMIHTTYTWKRQRIKHVVIDPEKL
ncbi:MAG: sialidase family protein [bacterium]|jgi:predicted neuraminidase